jgi:hypothetical protein
MSDSRFSRAIRYGLKGGAITTLADFVINIGLHFYFVRTMPLFDDYVFAISLALVAGVFVVGTMYFTRT